MSERIKVLVFRVGKEAEVEEVSNHYKSFEDIELLKRNIERCK